MRHLLNGKYAPNKQVTVNVVDAQGNLLDSFATQGNVNELQQATSGYAPKHRDEARRLIGAANRRLSAEMIVDDCLFDGRNLTFTIRLSGKRRKNPAMFQNPERHSFTTRRGKRMNATVNQVLAMPQMFSDESIAHAERMADKWQANANPARHASQLSQREKARRAQAQAAQAHRAALQRHYMDYGLSAEDAEAQHAIDKTMKQEYYAGLRTASNPNGEMRVVNARFKGKCAVTGEEYPAGTEIVKTEAGWAMAEHV